MTVHRYHGLPVWELALYGAFFVAVLPLITLRDFSVDNELRYLSIADEALRNHTWFSFTNHGLAYADKPPLYLWIVMLGRSLFGNQCMAFLSLFSLVPAFVTTHSLNALFFDQLRWRHRLAASAMLLTCGYFFALAFFLRMDMLMTMFIVLGMCSFWRMHEGRATKADRWLLPVWLFLGLFTKGPYGLLFPLLGTTAFLLYKGELRTWCRYWGLRTWGVLLGLSGLWLCAVYAEGGSDYFHNLVFQQTLDRSVRWVTHKHGWHYYLWTTWYAAAPWSLTLATLLLVAWRKGVHFNDLQHFGLLFCGTTFLLLSCMTSKMEVYLLPAYPFVVYSAAMTLPALDGHRVPIVVTRVLLAALAIAGGVLIMLALYAVVSGELPFSSPSNLTTFVAATVLTLSCVLSFRTLGREPLSKGVTEFVGGFLVVAFVAGFSPLLQVGYSKFCQELRAALSTKDIEQFAAWQVNRAENMDVLLDDRRVHSDVPPDSLERLNPHKLAYIVPRDSAATLPPYFQGLEVLHIGDFDVVVIP